MFWITDESELNDNMAKSERSKLTAPTSKKKGRS